MSGFNVTTYGISVNYPETKDIEQGRNFILLDIAGKQNPLLESFNIKNYFKNEKLNDKINESLNDQSICESILSDFIFEKSDILIVVIEQLSFAEQQMLSQLINQINNNKTKINIQKIFVIHNLMNLKSKSEIEYYISNVLKKSITFKLKERNIQPFHKDTKNKTYNTFFEDDSLKTKNIVIEHYIFGYDIQKENEKENYIEKEVRTFYNNPVIARIQEGISIESYKPKFDLNEEFYKYLENKCKSYIESSSISLEKTDEFIKSKDKLKKEDIKLKSMIINQKGFLDFELDEPIYSYEIYQNEENNEYYLEVIIELPQEFKIDSDIKSLNDVFKITISGQKKEEKEEGKKKEKTEEKDDKFPKNIYYDSFNIIIDIPRELEINDGGFFGFFAQKKKYKIQNIEKQKSLETDKDSQLHYLTFPVNIDDV